MHVDVEKRLREHHVETPSDMAPQWSDVPADMGMHLLQTAASLIALLTPDELIMHLLEQVVPVIPAADGGVLWLFDRRSSKLRVASLYGLPLLPATHALVERCYLSPGETMVGKAFQQHDVVSDVTQPSE